MIRASPLHLLYLSSITKSSRARNFKNGIHSFSAWYSAAGNDIEKQKGRQVYSCCSWERCLTESLHLYVTDGSGVFKEGD